MTQPLTLCWRKVRDDETEKEPTQRREFNTESVQLAQTLVREALQNTLDAISDRGRQTAHVIIGLHEPPPPEAGPLSALFRNVLPHLRASGIDAEGVDPARPRLLCIEDFGTTGLSGAWDRRDPDGGWDAFFRRFGASNKQGTRGGRWGLGKLVFTSVSRLRTLLALTVREGDPQPRPALLMGQTIAKYHSLDGQRFDSHGFLARPTPEGALQQPLTDPASVRRYAEALGFRRRDEPGLSIAIAFPDPAITRETLIRDILDNYFLQLLRGQLTVEVCGERLDADTFDAMVARCGSEAMRTGRVADFIRRMMKRLETTPDVIAPADWSAKGLEPALTDADRKRLKDACAAGDVLRVRFPLTLQRKDGPPQPTFFEVMMAAEAADHDPPHLCVRGLITLPNEARRFRERGYAIALIADDSAIAEFLGDAEGPAHTEWNAQEERLNDRWRRAKDRLADVRKAPRQLHALVAATAGRRDPFALIDWFSIPRQDSAVGRKAQQKPAGANERGRGDPPLPRRPKYRVSQCEGGFIVAAGEGLTSEDPRPTLRVRAAYDVPRGDPFKRHSPHDFDFREHDLEVEAEGCEWRPTAPNVARITVTDTRFRVKVTGFDPHRDLDVQARPVK